MQGSIIKYGTRLALLTAALSGLIAAGTGCGASHEGCAALAKAACAKQSECSAYFAKVLADNLDYCMKSIAYECEQSTGTPDVTFGDASAAVCAQAYAAMSCDDYFTGVFPPACRPTGNRPIASACGDDFQCQSNFCSRQANQCGVCATIPTAGQACTGACDAGLECAQGTCQPYRKTGETCDLNTCLPSLACAKGVCAPPMVGQACGAADECSGLAAQYCDGGTLMCEVFPFTVSKAGEVCGIGTTQAYLCGPALFCKVPPGANFGVCNALPPVGMPCGGNSGMGCAAPGFCVSGTCKNFERASCK